MIHFSFDADFYHSHSLCFHCCYAYMMNRSIILLLHAYLQWVNEEEMEQSDSSQNCAGENNSMSHICFIWQIFVDRKSSDISIAPTAINSEECESYWIWVNKSIKIGWDIGYNSKVIGSPNTVTPNNLCRGRRDTGASDMLHGGVRDKHETRQRDWINSIERKHSVTCVWKTSEINGLNYQFTMKRNHFCVSVEIAINVDLMQIVRDTSKHTKHKRDVINDENLNRAKWNERTVFFWIWQTNE